MKLATVACVFGALALLALAVPAEALNRRSLLDLYKTSHRMSASAKRRLPKMRAKWPLAKGQVAALVEAEASTKLPESGWDQTTISERDLDAHSDAHRAAVDEATKEALYDTQQLLDKAHKYARKQIQDAVNQAKEYQGIVELKFQLPKPVTAGKEPAEGEEVEGNEEAGSGDKKADRKARRKARKAAKAAEEEEAELIQVDETAETEQKKVRAKWPSRKEGRVVKWAAWKKEQDLLKTSLLQVQARAKAKACSDPTGACLALLDSGFDKTTISDDDTDANSPEHRDAMIQGQEAAEAHAKDALANAAGAARKLIEDAIRYNQEHSGVVQLHFQMPKPEEMENNPNAAEEAVEKAVEGMMG